MGSKADFYVGRGTGAEWLGSIFWDGLPAGIPLEIRTAKDEGTYREQVERLLGVRKDGVTAKDGWPWDWDTSHRTNYAYAFDREQVWACCFGSSWWKASLDEPDHTTLKRKAARLPNMALARKATG